MSKVADIVKIAVDMLEAQGDKLGFKNGARVRLTGLLRKGGFQQQDMLQLLELSNQLNETGHLVAAMTLMSIVVEALPNLEFEFGKLKHTQSDARFMNAKIAAFVQAQGKAAPKSACKFWELRR